MEPRREKWLELLWGLAVCSVIVWVVFFLFGCGAPPPETSDTRDPAIAERFAARQEAREAWARGEGPAEFRDLELEALWQEQGPEDLGQIEQAYSIKHTLDYQMGVDATAARMQCTRTNLIQTCSLLNTKNAKFYIESADFGPPGTGYNDEIYTYVTQLDAALGSWTFTEIFDLDSDPNITFVFRRGLCPGAWNSPSIAAFSCLTLSVTRQSLVEGTGVTGDYTAHAGATLWIDMSDLTQRATTTIRRLRLLRHASGHITLAGIGLGGRGDADAAAFASRMPVDVDFSPATISSGEVCRAEAYVPTQDGTVTRQQPSCGGAN